MLAVALLLLVGMAARRVELLPEGSAALLDAVVVRVSLPALILATVPGIPLSGEAVIPVAAAWGSLALLAIAVLAVARLAALDRRTTGTLLAVVPLGNTSFLGFPAIEALLGGQALGFAVVYDQLGSFLGLATWCAIVAGRYGTSTVVRPATGIARRLLRFPPFLALLAAIALRPVPLPEAVSGVFDLLGDTVTPLAMLAIGLRLNLTAARHEPVALGIGLALRMVAAPAAILAVAVVVDGSGLVWQATTLQAAMPPMVTASVVAAAAGLDGRLAAALAGTGVLLAMVTLPLWTLALT